MHANRVTTDWMTEEPAAFRGGWFESGRRSPGTVAVARRVLGLEAGEADPVRIILAAQIQLRRWRRMDPAERPRFWPDRVRAIVAARDRLLDPTTNRRGCSRIV